MEESIEVISVLKGLTLWVLEASIDNNTIYAVYFLLKFWQTLRIADTLEPVNFN